MIGFDNAGGFVELLRRDCGILVPYLDTGAMAAAVLDLLSDPTKSRRIIAIGKDIVSREFEFIDYVRDLVILAQGQRVSVIVPNYNYAHYLPGASPVDSGADLPPLRNHFPGRLLVR